MILIMFISILGFISFLISDFVFDHRCGVFKIFYFTKLPVSLAFVMTKRVCDVFRIVCWFVASPSESGWRPRRAPASARRPEVKEVPASDPPMAAPHEKTTLYMFLLVFIFKCVCSTLGW